MSSRARVSAAHTGYFVAKVSCRNKKSTGMCLSKFVSARPRARIHCKVLRISHRNNVALLSRGCMCITVLRIKARKHTYSYLFYIQSSASCNFILLCLVNTLLNCLWQCRCCFFRVVAANDMDIRAKNRV